MRQEAVQQALAALKNRPKPSLPMPSKRSSVLNRSPDRDRDDTGKLIVKHAQCAPLEIQDSLIYYALLNLFINILYPFVRVNQIIISFILYHHHLLLRFVFFYIN